MKKFNPRFIQITKWIDDVLRFIFFPLLKKKCDKYITPKSILIFDFHLLGDIVMLTPLLIALRGRYPDAYIGIAAGSWASDVLMYHPNLYDEHIVVSVPWVKKKNRLKKYINLLVLLSKIRKGKWSWGVEVRGDIRQIYLMFFSGIGRRIGYDFTGGGWLLTDTVQDDGKYKHIVEHHYQIAKSLFHNSCVLNDFYPKLWLSSEEEQIVKYSKQHNRKTIGVHLGASLPLRILPKSKALELLHVLLEKSDRKIILFQSVEIVQYLDDITMLLSKKYRKQLIIQSLELREFIVKIASCSLFVGMDSAGGHIAAALGVPVISIFGPAEYELVKPIGKSIKIVTAHDNDVHCRPCDQIHCKNGTFQYCYKYLDFESSFKDIVI